MQNYIKEIGLQNIDQFDLRSKRKIFSVDKIDIDYIVKSLNLGDDYDYVHKTNNEGFYMGYHMYGYQIYKKSKEELQIVPKFKISKWTLLIYESTYNTDFKGGIFEFVDGQRVYPKKNLCVLFDSRDVHMVHRQTNGERSNYIVKIY